MVPVLSISIMFTNMVLAILIPVILLIAVRKKYKASGISFLMGCLTFFVFALTLEQIFHVIVLDVLPFGSAIQNNIWMYAIYGGLAAGVFEEVGRYIVMKYTLKNYHKDSHNAVMFGVGHGGFEMMFILGVAMLNNWLYAIMINSNQTELILNEMDAASKVQLEGFFQQLIDTSPFIFLAAPVERISAIILQIALSVLVWVAVTKGQKMLLPLAIFLHFFVDALATILNNAGVNIVFLEAIVMAYSIGVAMFASKYIWTKYCKNEKTVSDIS